MSDIQHENVAEMTDDDLLDELFWIVRSPDRLVGDDDRVLAIEAELDRRDAKGI